MPEMKQKDVKNGLGVLREVGISIFKMLMVERSPTAAELDADSFPEEIHDIKDAIRLVASAHDMRGNTAESEVFKLYIGINDLNRGTSKSRTAPDKDEFRKMLILLFSASAKLSDSNSRRIVYLAFQHIIERYPFDVQILSESEE